MKVEWKGIIPEEARSWLSFSIQRGLGYEYNSTKKPYEIIVSSDDNNGINTDEIFFDIEANENIEPRNAIVTFYQSKGKIAKYLVKQAVGHIKVFEKQEIISNGDKTETSIVINPKTVNCNYNDTNVAFNATFSYKELSYLYNHYYYADTKEKVKELFRTITSDTKTISDVNQFTWSSDNGTITNGLLKFNKNSDRDHSKIYNVSVSYLGQTDNAIVTQGVDNSFVEYIVRTNIRDAMAIFKDNGVIVNTLRVIDSTDGSSNPYIAKFSAKESDNMSVTISGDSNETNTYNFSISPKEWNGNLNETIDVTVNSTFQKEFDDYTNNTKSYPNKVYDVTINIPHITQNGNAEYTADLPNGITDISTNHNFTKLQINRNVLKQGGDINYFVVKSPKHKETIKLSYSTDDLFKEDKVMTLVFDYGLLNQTLDTLPNVKVFRKGAEGFSLDMIENIFIATTTTSNITQDSFNVIKLSPFDVQYFTSDTYFTYLKVKEHPELIVNGNKVIVFIKWNTDIVPNEVEYHNHDITAARIPKPYTSLDNACFYSNGNIRTMFIGETVNTFASDCLAGFGKIEKIFIGSKTAPILDRRDDTGYTFRATESNGVAEGKNCVIYGVKGSYDSYHVDSNDPWKWDGCIKAPTTNVKVSEAIHQEIDDNIKTWRIDTDTYEVKNELQTFKTEVINKVTGSNLI